MQGTLYIATGMNSISIHHQYLNLDHCKQSIYLLETDHNSVPDHIHAMNAIHALWSATHSFPVSGFSHMSIFATSEP